MVLKEKWDFLEVEVKVVPDGRRDRLVELVRKAGPAGSGVARKPHVAFYDVYFDTPELTLHDSNAYLRIRFGERSFKAGKKYKMFYKDADPAAGVNPWLSRREVRSDLTIKDLELRRTGQLPGLAAELAYDHLEGAASGRNLVPVCVIASFREYFSLGGPRVGDPDMVNLSVEQSTAWSASAVDLGQLLGSGTTDWTEPRRTYEFELAEAELTDEGEVARDAFERLATLLEGEFETTTVPKYQQCVEQLDLRTQPRHRT